MSSSTKQLAWYIFGVFALVAVTARFVSYDAPTARELGSAIRLLSVVAAVVSGFIAILITQLRLDSFIRSRLMHAVFVVGALFATLAGIAFFIVGI